MCFLVWHTNAFLHSFGFFFAKDVRNHSEYFDFKTMHLEICFDYMKNAL